MFRLPAAAVVVLAVHGCATTPAPRATADLGDLDGYLTSREALFDSVYAQRPDRALELNPDEETAAARLEELKHAVHDAGGSSWPGESFFAVREQIEASELFAFLQRLPKGGMLHVHAGAMGDLGWLLDRVSRRPDCFVFRGHPTDGAISGALRIFSEPPPPGWVSLADELEGAEDPTLHREQLLRALTLGSEDVSREPWPEFATIFGRLRGLWVDHELTHDYLLHAIRHLVEVENLNYAELRMGLGRDLVPTLREIRDQVRSEGYAFDLRAIVNVARYTASGESDDDARARFGEIMRTTAASIRDNPDIMAGFDLVAEEDGGLPASFFAEELLELRAEGLDLPLFLHAGESSLPSTTRAMPCELDASCDLAINNNLFDALLLGTRRLGHGFALARLPGLTEEYRKRQIAVEVCPISNQILGYVADLRQHPAVTLLNAGLPLTLSSDDPGIFGYRGVTHDWWMATVAWNLDLRALKQLAENSLVHSALPEPDQEEMLIAWRTAWSDFISEVEQEAKR